MTSHTKSLLRAFLIVAVTVIGGCRDLKNVDGLLLCGPDRACPSGFVCAADNRCRSQSKSDSGIDVPPSGGTGGRGSGGAGGAGGTGGSPIDTGVDVPIDPSMPPGDGGGGDTAPTEELVEVTIQRSGNGSVTGTNVNCTEAICRLTVREGSSLELTATPAAGSDFKAWSGCTSSNGAVCSITGITMATTVTATFAPSNANLVVIKDGNGMGTVTGAWQGGGLDCGTTCSAMVPTGTQVTFTATPNEGSTVRWGDPCTGTGPCVITTAAEGTTVKATFTLNKVPLTISRTGNGSVTGSGGISCAAASCPVMVDYGSSITLQAVPAADHEFSSWTGCSSTSGSACTVTNIKAAAEAKVTFVPKKVTVTLQRSGRGRITSADGAVNCTMDSCAVMVTSGARLALTAVPEDDSEFKSWSGCPSASGATCTLASVTAPVTIGATFAIKNASFVIARQGNGKGSVTATWAGGMAVCGTNCSAALQPGTTVMLTGTAEAGSTLSWGAPCSGSGACMVTVAAGGTTIAANFTLNKYPLTVSLAGAPNAGGVTSVTAGVVINCGTTCTAMVDHGTAIELIASPQQNATSSFTNCPGSTATLCRLTMTAAASVTATFKWNNGGACTRAADCRSNICTNNVCCTGACNGPCDVRCGADGNCEHKPARTWCGSATGPAGPHTAIEKSCTADGACVAPTIQCPVATGVTTTCNLNTRACCIRPAGSATYQASCGIEPPNCNELPNAGDTHLGYSCGRAADCPLTYVCCFRYIEGGGNWASCLKTCPNGTIRP
ncbi:MAG TPA: hypothetical protein VGF45_10390 [Polyangia bacterium]